MSFAQLETWPDDGRRYELYDGEAIVVPAPNLPDLAVEVLSAATEKRDRGRKWNCLADMNYPSIG